MPLDCWFHNRKTGACEMLDQQVAGTICSSISQCEYYEAADEDGFRIKRPFQVTPEGWKEIVNGKPDPEVWRKIYEGIESREKEGRPYVFVCPQQDEEARRLIDGRRQFVTLSVEERRSQHREYIQKVWADHSSETT